MKKHLVGHDEDLNDSYVADSLWLNSVMLPVHHLMTEKDVAAVCNVLSAALQKNMGEKTNAS